jgi:hypothetical protein
MLDQLGQGLAIFDKMAAYPSPRDVGRHAWKEDRQCDPTGQKPYQAETN